MRQYTLLYIALAFFTYSIVGCKKNSFNLKSNTFLKGNTSLKVNFMSAYKLLTPTQIKVDDVRVSNAFTYATPFPGGGLNTNGGSYADYLALDPGSKTVSISFPFAGTNNDSVQLANATATLDANKYYSLYFSDTANNTKNLLLEDDNASPDSGFVKYRFVNLTPDAPEGFDLYFGTGSTSTTSSKVAGPVQYLTAGSYFTVPINTGSVWSIRPAGAAATTTASASYTSASSVTNQRVFTILSRGYKSVTPSSDVRFLKISFIYNR